MSAGDAIPHPQDRSLRDQAAGVASGEIDPAALLDATLERIGSRNPSLGAVAAVFPDESRAMVDAALPGPLRGVPVTIKDMYALPWRGFCNGTSRPLAPPSASTVFTRLRDAGAVVVGVDNQHFLGMGTTGVASAHGPARNPWNPERCAGGSSGGSAAAVAAGLVAGAVGSDSGGSTRLPAGWCGVVGLKVTYGSLPYEGYTGRASSFAAPGVFGREAADARVLAECLLGRTLSPSERQIARVGMVLDPFWQDVDPSVEAAGREALAAAGWELREVALDQAEHTMAAGLARLTGELTAFVPAWLLAEADPATRALLRFALDLPARSVARADRVRAATRRALVTAFDDCDVLAWPTNAAPAPPVDDPLLRLPSGPTPADGPNLRQAMTANLAGVPGISVPVGRADDGLPIGLQLVAPWGAEDRLLAAAEAIEAATGRRHIGIAPPPTPS